jgi:chromosome segregation protein
MVRLLGIPTSSKTKLSGFKSFVDPTTLHLPTNMTGVVGPNGCGKSNIIDAIRWVMGESSASRLRGDSLTDVIFSGSARKPVGQATVELVFDNSDQAITGEYAAFTEISVKRTVSRDGQISYYLNGARCRRRDITDLFLGTGLGPRSYSIIEQGMISQIIEAKPEELRTYLEEAAGISKYKERRKETETRIRHTRENLDRLNDVREEVGQAARPPQAPGAPGRAVPATPGRAARQGCAAQGAGVPRPGCGARRPARIPGAGRNPARSSWWPSSARPKPRSSNAAASTAKPERALGKAQAESYRVGAEIARVEQQIPAPARTETAPGAWRDEALTPPSPNWARTLRATTASSRP